MCTNHFPRLYTSTSGHFSFPFLHQRGSSHLPCVPSVWGVCVCGYMFKAFYLGKYPLKNRFHPLNYFSNINSFLADSLLSDVDTQKAAHGFTWTYSVGGQRLSQRAPRELLLGYIVMMLCALKKIPTNPSKNMPQLKRVKDPARDGIDLKHGVSVTNSLVFSRHFLHL